MEGMWCQVPSDAIPARSRPASCARSVAVFTLAFVKFSPVMKRRSFLQVMAASAAACALPRAGSRSAEAGRPRPSRAQLAWQRDELALFLHFGVNTFTDREWGDGKESPSIFN